MAFRGGSTIARLKARLIASAIRDRAIMPVAAFDPDATRTQTKIVDCETAQYSLTWTANASVEKWRGVVFVACDGNRRGGTTELAAHQRCQIFRSTDDGATFTDDGEAFNDPAKSNNPITAESHMQPNLFRPDGDAGPLMCFWNCSISPSVAYISTLSSLTGKWTHSRVEWQGFQPIMSSVVNGGAAPGNTLNASLDGMTDLALFFPSNPILLSDGTIAAPVTIFSQGATIDPAAPTSDSLAYRRWKCNAVMYSHDLGATWTISEPVKPSSDSRPSASWEPFLVEHERGTLCLFSRNMATNLIATKEIAQLIAYSENRRSWTPARATYLEIPPQRANATRATPGRWLQFHTDFTGIQASGQNTQGRYNGSIFASRHGDDDFIPAIPYTDRSGLVIYPQGTVVGGQAYVVWNRDSSNRRSLWFSKVAIPTDDGTAYVYPRHISERGLAGPPLAGSSPDALVFDGRKRATANIATTGTDLTFSGWIVPSAVGNNVIADSRDSTSGMVFQTNGVSLRGLALPHGMAMLATNKRTFVAAVVTAAARKITFYLKQENGALNSVDLFAQVLSVNALPADGETITIDGTVYTFRTTASASTLYDVQIGATAAATAANLVASVIADGQHRATNYGTSVLVGRLAGADFACVGSTNVTVASALPALSTASTYVRFGFPAPATSGIPGLIASLYNAKVFNAALTQANVKYLHDELASTLGLAALGGGTDPAAAAIALDPTSGTGVYPDILDVAPHAGIVGTEAQVLGEASCSLELPWEGTAVNVPWRLDQVPAGTDKYVIASIDVKDFPIRLYIDASAPNTLQLNGTAVATITDPTRWNEVEIQITPQVVQVGGIAVARTAPGRPRMYLGQAWPEKKLAATRLTRFDITRMSVAEYRERPAAAQAGGAALTGLTLELDPTGVVGSEAFSLKRVVAGIKDAASRFAITAGAVLQFGDGTNAADTTLYRGGPGQLTSNAEIKSIKPSINTVLVSGTITGDAQTRFAVRVDSSGRPVIEGGDGTLTRDVNLYRSAADRWTSDDHGTFGLGVATRSVNITGLTSAQVDALWTTSPPNGTIVTDPTNHVVLKRDNGAWYKSAAYTAV